MGDRGEPAHRVVHLQVEDLRHGAQREAQRDRVPVVAVHGHVVGEEQSTEVARRGGDVAEVHVALLERPPSRGRHPGVADRRRDRRHLLGGSLDRTTIGGMSTTGGSRRPAAWCPCLARGLSTSKLYQSRCPPANCPAVITTSESPVPAGSRSGARGGCRPRYRVRRGEARPRRGLPLADDAERLVS